jgi:hypothetical protein
MDAPGRFRNFEQASPLVPHVLRDACDDRRLSGSDKHELLDIRVGNAAAVPHLRQRIERVAADLRFVTQHLRARQKH